MSRILRVMCMLAAAAWAAVPGLAGGGAAEKPDRVVFLRSLPKDGGAPSVEHKDHFVVLAAVGEDDPYHGVVRVLQQGGADEVIALDPDKPKAAFKQLRAIRPGFVAIVIRPEALDVNVHFDFLERAARLDADPFVDFAFGYFTGATADEAIAFAKATQKLKRKKLPSVMLEFGPSTKPRPLSPLRRHRWAKGFKLRELWHPHDATDVAQQLEEAEGFGVLSASGHGMPDGVDHGLSGAALRASGLDLFPALYFSGPCYCGVTSRWFDMSTSSAKERRVAPEESFVLALINARAGAIFAGLDPDRGETNRHEFEHLLLTGDPLGFAAKSTYDECVVAYRREELILPRYRSKRGRPHRDIHDRMIAGGACRALFGDPRQRPIKRAGDDPFQVSLKKTKKGVDVVWKHDDTLGRYWGPVDVYRAEGRWTHRVRFTFEVPIEDASMLRRFEVQSVEKDGKALAFTWPTAALEVWAGTLRVHGMLIFPPNHRDRALWNGKAFEARFRFRK